MSKDQGLASIEDADAYAGGQVGLPECYGDEEYEAKVWIRTNNGRWGRNKKHFGNGVRQ